MSVRARKPITTVVSKAAAYDTILRPIITEKATIANENGSKTKARSGKDKALQNGEARKEETRLNGGSTTPVAG